MFRCSIVTVSINIRKWDNKYLLIRKCVAASNAASNTASNSTSNQFIRVHCFKCNF